MTEIDTRYQRISEILHDSARDENLLIAVETLVDIYAEEKTKKEHLEIPLSLFSHRKLGVLEALVKCLKENFSLSYSKIAHLLNRDDRTIWATYHEAQNKLKEKFALGQEKYLVPINTFSDRRLAPLESLVLYLKDEARLEIKQIADLLKRNYRTIWLSYRNGIKKKTQNEE